VLVERVEKFASEFDWMRAYGEINEFEEQLAESGAIVAKFWLSITPGEQLQRFKARQTRPTSASRSPPRTGATARSGPPTSAR
jgi:polyphosphate kinase 2 (PPK2 family)